MNRNTVAPRHVHSIRARGCSQWYRVTARLSCRVATDVGQLSQPMVRFCSLQAARHACHAPATGSTTADAPATPQSVKPKWAHKSIGHSARVKQSAYNSGGSIATSHLLEARADQGIIEQAKQNERPGARRHVEYRGLARHLFAEHLQVAVHLTSKAFRVPKTPRFVYVPAPSHRVAQQREYGQAGAPSGDVEAGAAVRLRRRAPGARAPGGTRCAP